MKGKYNFFGFIAIFVIMLVLLIGCVTTDNRAAAPVRAVDQNNWEAMLTEMFPGARALDTSGFRNRWGTTVVGNLVMWDGSNFHDFIYRFPPNVQLRNYEALILVIEVFGVRKPVTHPSPTNNMSFNLRMGPTEVPHPDPDNRLLRRFILADEAESFEFPEHGVFIAGITDADFARLANSSVHGDGFNIQNGVWAPPDALDPNNFRTGFNMRFHAVMLLPVRDTSGFGLQGDVFVLDPALFNRAGQWGTMDAAGSLLVINNNGAINYTFPVDLVRANFNTLVIEYTVLDSIDDHGNMNISFFANNHAGANFANVTLNREPGTHTLKLPLPATVTSGFSIRNDLDLDGTLSFILKINSMRLE